MLLQNDSLSDSQRTGTQRPSTIVDHRIAEEQPEQQKSSPALHILDCAPAPGWTVHVSNDGRLYYCNHITRSAGWLPPVESWKTRKEVLPYGWERAVDDTGRSYYINHINKTTTYETPAYKSLNLPKPKPRTVTLERSTSLGFGFVAGSEKPVIVRFVTEGGPSAEKLLPGDQILSVNEEDVKSAPREHVISLVRSCTKSVTLQVCQPSEQQGVRKSTLLSATKRARLKSKPSRVRFAESVCVNGAPLFPQSAFTLGDLCVPPMANVLKVFLENGQTKSFKYDSWTTVQNVVNSLQAKLCIRASEHFSLVVEHIKSLKRNKLTLLDPHDSIARIASQPGAHKLRCLFRVTFVPVTAAELAQQDLNALDYLYSQCCNDVIQERFSPELQCDTALRLAALHICQHALANNISASKLTVKIIERQFGLERFVPASILESLKRKEVRKVVGHFLKLHSSMAGPGKQLTILQVKLHYLDIVSQLPSYGAKCFSTGPKGDAVESVILVSPKFGISQITGQRNFVFQPVPIANIEDMKNIEVKIKDEITRIIFVILQNDKVLQISLEEKDAMELVLVFRGYFKLITGQELPVDQEKTPNVEEDVAPSYLADHKVVPEKWSYIDQSAIKTVSFGLQPVYKGINKKTNGLYNTVGRHSKPTLLIDYSFDRNMNSSLSNRNYQCFNVNNMDMTNVNSLNEELLKRMHETQIKNNFKQYPIEEQDMNTLQSLSEWQETSVDVESDSDEPGKLKHSDSLTLLNRIHKEDNISVSHATMELLKQDTLQSESDNDSLYTPHNSPDHKKDENELNLRNRVSFGLRSPNTPANKHQDFQDFLQQIYDLGNTKKNNFNSINNIVFDTDIIDLTSIPPPLTPDKLDSALPTPINVPPVLFADSVDRPNTLDTNDNQDLEEFLASVSVPPPTQKVTPAMELTPEEIMAYIIPPPPSKITTEHIISSDEHSVKSTKEQNAAASELSNLGGHNSVSQKIRNFELQNGSSNKTYKGTYQNGSGDCVGDISKPVLPLPRRSVYQKPPERPPKEFLKDRKRSHSLNSEDSKSNNAADSLPVPKLPPRISASNLQPPQRLSLYPKKLELALVSSSGNEKCLNSREAAPRNHLQEKSKSLNIDDSLSSVQDQRVLKESSAAVATPIYPYVGKVVGMEKREQI